MSRATACACLLTAALLVTANSPGSVPWTTYHGQLTGNRYSSLSLINNTNVASLILVNNFVIPTPTVLESTPLVYGNVMYIASLNSVFAYNLNTGKLIWSFVRPRTPGVVQDAWSGVNRGVALGSNTVYLATDNAHLIALNATTGAVLWEVIMADFTKNYGSTSAPLHLPGLNLVVCGMSGGDSGIRGYLAAYDATTGALAWRFFTTPASPQDPLAATWGDGSVLPHGGGAPWLTGTFDSTTNTLYWGVGNPGPDFNGDNRQGANLYTSSVLALNPTTGALRWHFQYSPHTVWDHDGTSTPMLVDATWQGQPRNLLLNANRNGYFYVLDRSTGKFLAATPFVKNLTWATGVNAMGVPTVNSAAIPTTAGVQACPPVWGANSYQSSAYSPASGLFYVQALEGCSIFVKISPGPAWKAGQEYQGGLASTAAGVLSQKHLRAIDPSTGATVWDYAQSGYSTSFGGVLATAGGLVFFGDDAGAFSAVGAHTGQLLWTYKSSSRTIKASPMTYELNGRQYVAIAFANSVAIFGLPGSGSTAPTLTCPTNTGPVGTAYSSSLGASGGTPPYTFTLSAGALPPGLHLASSTGSVTGTPSAGGIFTFTPRVVDSTGGSGGTTQTSCGITTTPLPVLLGCPDNAASVGAEYTALLIANGGEPPYNYSVSAGALPPGLNLTGWSGVLTGSPTQSGTFSFTAKVADSTGTPAGVATHNCSIVVN